jgi:hypothetical protein
MRLFLILLVSLISISSFGLRLNAASSVVLLDGYQTQKVDQIIGLLENVRSVLSNRLLTEQENAFLVKTLTDFRFEIPERGLSKVFEKTIDRKSPHGNFLLELPDDFSFSNVELSVWLVMIRNGSINGYPTYASWSSKTLVSASFGLSDLLLTKNSRAGESPLQYFPELTDEEILGSNPSFEMSPTFNDGDTKIKYKVLNLDDPCCTPGLLVAKVRAKSLTPEFASVVKPLREIIIESQSKLILERENVFLFLPRIEKLISAFDTYRKLL